MSAAAVQDASVGPEAGHLLDHVFAVPLDVAVDDEGAGGDRVADHYRVEQLPLLLGVQVAVDVGQIPGQVAIDLAVQDKGWGDRPAEGGVAKVPGVLVAHRLGVVADEVRGDLDLAGVVAQPDVHVIRTCPHHGVASIPPGMAAAPTSKRRATSARPGPRAEARRARR